MKIKIVKTTIHDYDEKKELKRLKSCFKGDVLERQLKIFNHFINSEFEELKEAYNNLPYDEEEECAEQEYVGSWSCILYGGWGENHHVIDTKYTVEYLKDEKNRKKTKTS